MSSHLVKPNGRSVNEDKLLGVIEIYHSACKVRVPNVSPKDLIRMLMSLCINLIGDCLDNKAIPLVQPIENEVNKTDN